MILLDHLDLFTVYPPAFRFADEKLLSIAGWSWFPRKFEMCLHCWYTDFQTVLQKHQHDTKKYQTRSSNTCFWIQIIQTRSNSIMMILKNISINLFVFKQNPPGDPFFSPPHGPARRSRPIRRSNPGPRHRWRTGPRALAWNGAKRTRRLATQKIEGETKWWEM